ncbi:type II toxin-antitoxin system VapC family toxin [Neobacillus drentensis]|uniref:type II toxin-antitoxin system VapC family toxin n=1 Tax=Neobacillus drentensis TaxID=220684 RepID=UPI002FFFDFC1
MSRQGYFLDTSAIAKLYLDEVGSHKMKEIFENNAFLAYSELAYVETISALRKVKNKGLINEDELSSIVASFQNDFFKERNETDESNMYPISLSDVVFIAPEVMLQAHKLKDEIDPSLQYLQSLDALQLSSWVYLIDQEISATFVTSDARLARIASIYKDSKGLEAEVINLGLCTCEICETLRQADRAAS